VEAIVPVEDWELLGPAQDYPAALAFARTTVSLRTYPSLSDDDMRHIVAALRELDFDRPISSVLR
jgi:dTDP-4-amino-4,6-dideoxygalactose transaminase